MNRKTFVLALAFFALTLALFGAVVYFACTQPVYVDWFDFLFAGGCVCAAALMVRNEYKKKKRRHLDEVNPHKIP